MRRSVRLAALRLPAALVLAGGTLLAIPVGSAVSAPCTMSVQVDRTSTETFANGVERSVYDVKVSWNGKSQSAEVHRMLMPGSAQPRLVTRELGSLGQLRTQLDSKKGARGIAAVNGDFFYGYRIDGDTVYLPRNASVTHGSPVRLSKMKTRVVGVDTNGQPFAGQIGLRGRVTRGSETFILNGLNWHSLSGTQVGLYTPAWSESSVAHRPIGSVEWVLRKGKIVDVRTGNALGRTVAARTKVVAFGQSFAQRAKRARVGNTVELSVKQSSSTPGVQLKEAVGRGLTLMRDGAVDVDCANGMYLARPRTTVGWRADGTWMSLTVPGTGYDRNGYRIGGLGLAQEANVAKALGFVNAVELDGGGSTTAYVRRADNDWDRVDDRDSIWQRPIPNALIWVKPRR